MATGTELSVTWPQALGWRLDRHLLSPLGDHPVADVVRRLGAVLSMDESLAELAVRIRRRDSAPGELARAFAAGEVIKAFAFRGSMHYLTPEDGGAYLAIRCAGRQWELPSWRDYYNLSPADWPRFREAVREVLSDGALTVAELGTALTSRAAYRHLGPVFDENPWTLLKPLTWQGDMGFGPPRSGQHTFQRLDHNPRWAGVWDLDDAGRHAVTQYFAGYGPADADLVHYWLGNGLSAGTKRLRGWLADLQDRLVAVDIEGQRRHVLREDVESLLVAQPSTAVRFLPGHDQWVIGPGTKETHVVPPDRRTPVTRKANPVTVGGVVRGTWATDPATLVVTWLDDEPPPRKDLEEEADRLGGILDRPLRLVINAS
ncbi:MAG: DNA glycosylase AlkZ-like family protein [Kineosporiaceae bacterium]